ncbi:MAG TPA: PKD domain-containing protein, partial [Polyangia bacterium]
MRARSLLVVLVATAVAACGGPKPPVAVAGADQMVTVGELVKLDGSGSHDPSGKPLSYQWEFVALPAGSHATLNALLANGSTAVNPSFVADVGGDFVVRLTVHSDAGTSAPSDVKVTASMASCGNNLPVAQIGILAPFAVPAPVPAPPMVAAQFILGNTVQLDGSTSSTLDNAMPCSLNKELFYSWRFVSLPTGSNAAFNDAQIVDPSFRVETKGEYVAELVVKDSAGLTSAPVRVKIVAYDPRVTIPGGSGTFNSLVLDPGASGTPKIAFYNNNQRRAQIAICTGSCDTAPVWTIKTIDNGQGLTPPSSDVGSSISLGASSTGTLYAAYYDAINCRSIFAVSADHGNTWTPSVIDANSACLATARNGQYIALAVSPLSGNPAVAYQYNNAGTLTLRYAVCTAGCATGTPTWVMSTADGATQNTGFFPSLAFDPTGTAANKPAIAYRVDGNGGATMYAACSANCDAANATWATATVDANLGGIQANPGSGSSASLAFASTGAPSIAYRDDQA